MKIFKQQTGNGSTSSRLPHKNRRRLKKADIGLPEDFVHVATVKPTPKIELDLNDPIISSFLQRAEVSADALSNPEIHRLVKKFIERVGLEAIRKESESITSDHHLSQTSSLGSNEVNVLLLSINNRDFDSTTAQSFECSSVVFSSEHDVDLTTENDDVFTEEKTFLKLAAVESHQHKPKNSSKEEITSQSEDERKGTHEIENDISNTDSKRNDDTDAVNEAPTTPTDKEKASDSKNEHAMFLDELKAALRRREKRMKEKIQAEIERGESGWSGWKSPTKSKCQVSFFAPDSPSPKPRRIVHTEWDISIESEQINEIKESNGTERKDSYSFDATDSGNMKQDKNALQKPRLPLTKGTEAINKLTSNEELAIRRPSSNDDILKISDNTHSTTVNEKDAAINQSLNLLESTQMIVQSSDLSDDQNIPCIPTDKSDNVSRPIDFTETKTGDSSKRQKPSQKKNLQSWFNKRNSEKKSSKNNHHVENACEVKNTTVDLKEHHPYLENVEGQEKKIREEKKHNRTLFSSLTKRKVKESVPSASDPDNLNPVSKDVRPLSKKHSASSKSKSASFLSTGDVTNGQTNVKEEEPLSKSTLTFPLKTTSSIPSNKHPIFFKGKRDVKKKDICVMRDMRHITHIAWDPLRHMFVLHHTDDDVLRKHLLEKKLCEEAPIPKQRRHSYSMAIDIPDLDIDEKDPRSSVQSNISNASNTTVFSRGGKKRMPIPRPRSAIPRISTSVTS